MRDRTYIWFFALAAISAWGQTAQVQAVFTEFAFKLLSRLAGERLPLRSNIASVHGFATRDDRYLMENLLLWNFSDQAITVAVTLQGWPPNRRARHITLEALAPSSDENARLHPEPYAEFKKSEHQFLVQLQPYAIHYWSLE